MTRNVRKLKLGVGFVLAVAVLFVMCQPGRPHHFGTLPADPAGQDALVRKLLKKSIEDERTFSNRSGAVGSRITRLVPEEVWLRIYRPTFAGEVLISYGRSAVEPLIRVLLDPEAAPRLRCAAAYTLARLDDPRILDAFLLAGEKGLIDPFDLAWVVSIYLPVHRNSKHLEPNLIRDWLSQQVSRGYEGAVLEQLGVIVNADYAEGGLSFAYDSRTVRYLNRIYDSDLDAWLRQVAPEAMDFRMRELRRGYDPAVAVEDLLGNKDGVTVVYGYGQDAESFKALQKAIESFPEPAPGWEKNLAAWFNQNKHLLRYNYEYHRFEIPPSSQPGAGPQ